jgi:hypothetical protein
MSATGRARSYSGELASDCMFLVIVGMVVKIGVNANKLEQWRSVRSMCGSRVEGVCIVTSFPSGGCQDVNKL